MKLSRFNVWTKNNNSLILYNSMTGALSVFDDENREKVLDALETGNDLLMPQEFIHDLLEDGYLLDENVDELVSIDKLISTRKKLVEEYFFSILLSLSCNFNCFYCFEKHNDSILDEHISNKLILMMAKVSGIAKRIAVDWYGGEPLLSFDMLRKLNDKFMSICLQKGANYETSITTNGYLLNPDIIDYLKTIPLTHLQITIDGPPETHNISRPLKNGSPTFDVILRNIEQSVNNGLSIFIRVNITEDNIDKVYELYRILDERGLKNKVRVLLKPVVSSSAHPCGEICLSDKSISGKMIPIYVKAAQNGWIVFPNVDSMQCLGFCVADFPSQFIIDPLGNLYKCGELFAPDECIGKLGENGQFLVNQEKYKQWVEKTPLSFSECRTCNILPICMGGCNMKRWWKKIDCCEELKHNLPDFLQAMVLNQNNILKKKGGDVA